MPECGNNQAHIKKHSISYYLYMEKNTTKKLKTFKLYKVVFDIYLDF